MLCCQPESSTRCKDAMKEAPAKMCKAATCKQGVRLTPIATNTRGNSSVDSSHVAQNGGVAGRRWQPFEAHIPFMLQLKIDFNLAGMGFLRLACAHFRPPLPPSGARRGADWCTSPLIVTYEPGGSSAHPRACGMYAPLA